MEVENKRKKREWVKTAAIIFLVVLLILTFFSQTIMNHSLPEVATQMVASGTINAKIRGSGTVTANEAYEVVLKQTRKVQSVMVKEGQAVNAGDVLFILESEESDEVKAAQDALEQAELAYQKALLSQSNTTAQDKRALEKAQKAYDDALAEYKAYTSVDVSQLTAEINSAKAQLQAANQQKTTADAAVTSEKSVLTEAENQITNLTAQISELQTIQDKNNELAAANAALSRDQIIYGKSYEKLEDRAKADVLNPLDDVEVDNRMAAYAKDINLLIVLGFSEEEAKSMSDAYTSIKADKDAVIKAETALERLLNASPYVEKADQVPLALSIAQHGLEAVQATVANHEANLRTLQQSATAAQTAVDSAQAAVDNLSKAQTAATTLTDAKNALEDLIFNQSLGSDVPLDLKAQKENLDELRKNLQDLKKDYDAAEVTANVSGTIGTISATAGNTIGAGSPLATINVTSRGYTIQIQVTNEQAKQVKLGDTANVVNYYWGSDITATLEGIKNASGGKGKVLEFKITGDVEPGTNLTLSIGQKSASYDALVPNSAVRTDTNGTFVLAIVSKNSPLGNRYIATRVDVQELAKDDNLTAVSGLSSGDYVITTSTKPVEAGTQVRLVDDQ